MLSDQEYKLVQVLSPALVNMTHSELRRFLMDCGVPAQVVAKYPVSRKEGLFWFYGPSKREVVDGVLRDLVSTGGSSCMVTMFQRLKEKGLIDSRVDVRLRTGVNGKAEGRQGGAGGNAGQSRPSLVQLDSIFRGLLGEADHQKRGHLLEGFLQSLWRAFGMKMDSPFQMVGEEIDGSFWLDGNVFLVEAKWTAQPVSTNALYEFRSKIEGKLEGTRGFFVSINGYSHGAVAALITGKPPNMLLLGGQHIMWVLESRYSLQELMRESIARASKTAEIYWEQQ